MQSPLHMGDVDVVKMLPGGQHRVQEEAKTPDVGVNQKERHVDVCRYSKKINTRYGELPSLYPSSYGSTRPQRSSRSRIPAKFWGTVYVCREYPEGIYIDKLGNPRAEKRVCLPKLSSREPVLITDRAELASLSKEERSEQYCLRYGMLAKKDDEKINKKRKRNNDDEALFDPDDDSFEDAEGSESDEEDSEEDETEGTIFDDDDDNVDDTDEEEDGGLGDSELEDEDEDSSAEKDEEGI
jgi:hypothetical protein